MKPSVLMIIIILTAAFAQISCGTSTTIPVKSGQSIQAAIKAAHPGDTIEVYSGVYHENLIINKPITLKGIDSGSGHPIINVNGGSAITLNAGGIILEGIQATAAGAWETDAGIKVMSNGNIIRNNIASDSRSAGIVLIGAKNNTIMGNIANSNINYGISLMNSSDNILEGNTANQNKYGIKLTNSDGNDIGGNTVNGNRLNGIYIEKSILNLIEGNYVGSNWAGVSLDLSKDNIIRKNEIIDNEKGIYLTYQNNTDNIKSKGKGVYISYSIDFSSPGRSANNTIYLNNLSNVNNAYDDGLNHWDNGKLGNNYSDFNEPHEGCDGKKVCSSEHVISGGKSIDGYPLAIVAVKSNSIAISSTIASSALASSQIASSIPEGTGLRLEKRDFAPGGEIRVGFTAPKDHEAWVAIAQKNESWSQQYIGKNISGILIFTAPEKEGKYYLRMYSTIASSRYGNESLAVPFTVAAPHISASPSELGTCEKVYVSYMGASGDDNGWIGMYPVGSSDSVSKQYLQGKSNGTITFSTPTAGSYEFRMFGPDASKPLCVSNVVKVDVKSGIHVVAEPSRVAPGGTVTVTFWGSPVSGTGVIGMYGVTRPDKFHIEKKPIGARSCGTITFKAPMEPGQYDFRMFGDDINRPILGQSNIVTVV